MAESSERTTGERDRMSESQSSALELVERIVDGAKMLGAIYEAEEADEIDEMGKANAKASVA